MWVTASFADHAEEARVIFQQELNWDLCRKTNESKRSFVNTSTMLLIFAAALHPAGSRSCSGLTSLCVSWGRVWISKQGYSFTSGQRRRFNHPPNQKAHLIQPCPSCDHISFLWLVMTCQFYCWEAQDELYLERNAAFKCSLPSATFDSLKIWKHHLSHLEVLLGQRLNRSCKVSAFRCCCFWDFWNSAELLCAEVGERHAN